jgi:hypothetical protein
MADYVFSGLNSPGGSGEDSSAGENDGVLRVSYALDAYWCFLSTRIGCLRNYGFSSTSVNAQEVAVSIGRLFKQIAFCVYIVLLLPVITSWAVATDILLMFEM